jgi:hypothetical protein
VAADKFQIDDNILLSRSRDKCTGLEVAMQGELETSEYASRGGMVVFLQFDGEVETGGRE